MSCRLVRATGIRAFITLSLFLQLASVQGAPPYVHDPCIIKQAKYYYLFRTAPGIAIKRSLDLLQWENLKPAFTVTPKWIYEEVPGFNGSLWAPDVSFDFCCRGIRSTYNSAARQGASRGAYTMTRTGPSCRRYGCHGICSARPKMSRRAASIASAITDSAPFPAQRRF